MLRRSSNPYQQGFTLLELMIVIAVISILASIALPSYRDYVTRGKITEAVSTLSDMRVRLEQFFQDNRTYTGACVAGTLAPLPANTQNFQFSCSSLSDTTYVVRATGFASMNGFVYEINQANTRTTVGVPAGWGGSGSNCWVLKKDGSC